LPCVASGEFEVFFGMPEESSEHRHRRRRRRHRRDESSKTKLVIGIVLAAIVVIGGLIAVLVGPDLITKMNRKGAAGANGNTAKRNGIDFVGFGRQTIIIMNPTEQDWGYTTITVNTQYVAHCPEIPKGTQFELFLKQLIGPKGQFDPKAEKVQTVKIEPEGLKPIDWTPPIVE
jgi:hypothetical protein